MLLRMFWPECREFHPREPVRLLDGLWVEATREEAEAEILPRLAPEAVAISHRAASADWYARMIGDPPRPYCYLVAEDLSVILPQNCRFPVHQLWNAYSPFGEFEAFDFSRLEEIRHFAPPSRIRWLGIGQPALRRRVARRGRRAGR